MAYNLSSGPPKVQFTQSSELQLHEASKRDKFKAELFCICYLFAS